MDILKNLSNVKDFLLSIISSTCIYVFSFLFFDFKYSQTQNFMNLKFSIAQTFTHLFKRSVTQYKISSNSFKLQFLNVKFCFKLKLYKFHILQIIQRKI